MSPACTRPFQKRDPAAVPVAPVVSIVMPARNEAAGIQQAIAAVHAELERIDLPFEIIVGDSASTDGTAHRALALELPRVRVIRADRPGKGLALTRAMVRARGAVIGFIDSDLEISVEYLQPAIHAVLAGADAAIGSKAIDPALAASRSPLRRIATQLANRLIRFSLGTSLSDHQAGMKVFRRDSLLSALKHVQTTGWLWDTELLATLCASGASIVEVPVETTARRPSHLRSIRQFATAGLELAHVCMRMRAHRNPGATRVPVTSTVLLPAR